MEDIKKMLGILLCRVNNIEAHVKYLKRTAQDLQQSSSKRIRDVTMLCRCGGDEEDGAQPIRGRCFYCMTVLCEICMVECFVCGLLLHARCSNVVPTTRDGGTDLVCKDCIVHCTDCGETFPIIDDDISFCNCCGQQQCPECLDIHKTRRNLLYFASALECPLPILHALKSAFGEAYKKEREDLHTNPDDDDE